MRLENGNNASIITFRGKTPKLHPTVFTAEGVKIIGDVKIGKNSSVWYNSVIRGDVHYIRIGEATNVQDLCMLHVTHDTCPLNIGDRVTIGHGVKVHGCTIENDILIGIGAVILDNAVVHSNSLIGAGALIREGFEVPEGTLAAGVPARIIRDLTDEEIERVREGAPNYMGYVREYLEELKRNV